MPTTWCGTPTTSRCSATGLHQQRPTASALRADLLQSVGADDRATSPVARRSRTRLDDLRIAYRRLQLQLAARDLTVDPAVDDVAAELADLAAAALDAALAIARAELPEDAEPVRLALIGMGKCGGRELNYVSDVDVIYVAEPLPDGDETQALQTANRLAAAVARTCSASDQGGIALGGGRRTCVRKGGRAPWSHDGEPRLVLQRWAKTWEFQALLKARPVAGDRRARRAYVEAVSPLVWRRLLARGLSRTCNGCDTGSRSSLPKRDVDRQLKLGPGGLRDVEFSVQLLQLVHGRSDESFRHPNTLRALAGVRCRRIRRPDDARLLDEAYRFLRTLEHRIQLFRLRRTHLLPEDDAILRRLGRSVGFRKDPVVELDEELAAAYPRGQAVAREALLSSLARRSGQLDASRLG